MKLDHLQSALAALPAASHPEQTAVEEASALEAKLDLLERALDVTWQESKQP